jgi:hypothetical protein
VRKPLYLSGATRSVSILPVVSGAPNQTAIVIDLAAGGTGCTGSGPTLACSGTLKAPVGETSFTVTTYAGPNATGAILSVGSFTLDVKAASNNATISNATSLSIDGVPASLALTVTPAALTIGDEATVSANVTALDASGAIIIGPGQYTTAIALETITPVSQGAPDPVLVAAQSTDFTTSSLVPDCTYPVVKNVTYCNTLGSILAPGVAIPLTYAGEFVPATSIRVVAESPGLASKAVTVTVATGGGGGGGCVGSPVVVCPGTIIFQNALSTPVPLKVTEPTNPSVTSFTGEDNCQGIAFLNNSNATTQTGDSFTVEPGSTPGSCTMVFQDVSLNSTTLNVTTLSAPPSPTPSPSPTPVVTATPVPPGPIKILPSNTFEFAGPTAPPANFTASEPGVTSFTIDQSACAGIVSITPPTGTAFTVTPVASLTQGGTCTASVLDPSGQFSDVKFYVDGVTVVVN